ncbi:MAG: leucine-rich repeat domain-containing protein, partial [Prevotellaceae bacterium]|nr:leucine-rich repeat domain-containing protein [Prevotellaceae bacterium]
MKILKKLVVLVVCWLFASFSADVYAQTTHLSSPGTLKNVEDIKSATQLTLTGVIDARDIRFMRDNMSYLTELDLSEATIVAYNGDEGTSTWGYFDYPANEMPQYSFGSSNTSLTSIILPNSMTSIGDEAFADCSSLNSVVIPAGVTSIGFGAFASCTGLTSI